jgi:DamX protein
MRQDPIIAKSDDDNEGHLDTTTPGQALEDYRQRYGLSVDPFGEDQYFPFFTGGQRRELLDQVIHLCQFGHGIPMVLGERGVGKTRLALAVYESLGDKRACFISALPTSNADLLLHQIARHFGVQCSDNESQDQLIIRLSHLAADEQGYDIAIAIIDNAHDLDDQTLSVLLKLQQAQPSGDGRAIKLVLCGDLSLSGRLEQLDPDAGIAPLYVERFSLSETVDYLNFRMEMADYLGPEMFTESKVEPWWRGAHGQLAIVHRFAHEQLLEAVLPPLSRGSRPFPTLHIIAIALLGGVVLMTFLYRGSDNQDGQLDAQGAQRVPINLQQRPPELTSVSSMSAIDTYASTDAVPGVVSPAPLSTAQVSSSSLSDQPISNVEAQEQLASSPDDKNRVTISEPQVAKSAAVASTSSAAVDRGENTPARTSSRLTDDEEVLLSWAGSDFTLQLLGVSTRKAAEEYISNQANRDDLLLFRTIRQGKDWFVVVAGRYRSSGEAKSAIANLPSHQAKAGPWPRQIKEIQQDIAKRR